MKKVVSALAVAGAMYGAAAQAKKDQAPVDPGPRPTDAEYRQIAERAALAGFFDPGSAEFQWPFGIVGGYFKPVLQGKKVGWWTCGQVNGKNRMGGYVGFRTVVVVVNNGAAVFSATGDGGNYDFVNLECQQAINKGMLPRADATTAVAATPPSDAPQFGFSSMVVPDGIYLATIVPGSVAATAGLAPGMVIEKVNGISVKGMDMATAGALLKAIEGEASFNVIGKGLVKLTKAPIAVAQ